MKVSFSVCALLLLTTSAHAGDIKNPPILIGGGQTCSSFIQIEMGKDSDVKLAQEAYTIGYASAVISSNNFKEWNLMKIGGNVGKSLEDSKKDINLFIVDWMRNFCSSNPNVVIASASLYLYYDMQKKGL